MKTLNKKRVILVLSLVIILVASSIMPCTTATSAKAATIALTKSNLTLTVGESSTLKVNGTKDKITWSTNKKAVASVNQKGKVTAKKAGTAKITATVGGKKYTCTVKVKENELIANAPFKAKQVNIGKVNFVIPKSYIIQDLSTNQKMSFPPSAMDGEYHTACMFIYVQETGTSAPKYSVTKKAFLERLLEDNKREEANGAMPINDYKASDYETKLGTAVIMEYNFDFESYIMYYTLYYLVIDNYEILVTTYYMTGTEATPDVNVVGEYILNSITIK